MSSTDDTAVADFQKTRPSKKHLIDKKEKTRWKAKDF
jgi:hypothetical protein